MVPCEVVLLLGLIPWIKWWRIKRPWYKRRSRLTLEPCLDLFSAQFPGLAATPLLVYRSTVAAATLKPKAVRPATVDAMMDIVRARYGKHLTEEQLKEVQRGIGHNVFVAERMKKFKLANGDEPAFIFQADV